MVRLLQHHKVLTDGVGKCSVPMWMNGCPAGFCDKPAYGKQEKGAQRGGNWGPGWAIGRWYPGGVYSPPYAEALACYGHDGPEDPALGSDGTLGG